MKRGKKGLSSVVTTLIIILISLVAISIIWIVIRNIVQSGSEQIDVGKFVIDMNIKNVVQNSTGTDVTIKRNAGQGNLDGVKIIVYDGTNSYQFDEKTNLSELETRKFTLNYTGPVRSVSVAPIIKTGSSDTAQNSVDTLSYSGYDAAKNMPGLVSWWRFDGNAKDEMGRNNGVVVGSPQIVNGKYGKAYNFTAGSYVNVPDNASLRLQNQNMTMVAWGKLNNDDLSNLLLPLIFKGGGGSQSGSDIPGYYLYLFDISGGVSFRFGAYTNGFSAVSNRSVQKTSWNYFVITTNMTALPGTLTWQTYLNGNFDKRTNKLNMQPLDSTGIDLMIGSDDNFNSMEGAIDEVMIFNRTLSSSEIQALYNLDLSN